MGWELLESKIQRNYLERSRILVATKDENIDNHRHIGSLILWIYQDILGDISGYFDKKNDEKKIDQNS